jgi:predicted nucleotide-binding protein
MEQVKAVRILQDSRKEIYRLKLLPYGNREFVLWKTRIEETIKTGLDDSDLTVLEDTDLPVFIVTSNTAETARQHHYLELLAAYDTNLEKVIAKYQQINVEPAPPVPESHGPRVYISHGKDSRALSQIVQFVTALGLTPLLLQGPSRQDQPGNDQIDNFLEKVVCVLVLATGDIEIEGILNPAQNVIYEMGLAQRTHRGRIIYLLEKDLTVPAVTRNQVWAYFDPQNLESAFIHILTELKTMGIIEITRP